MKSVTKKQKKQLFEALIRNVRIDGEYLKLPRRRTCAECKRKLNRRVGRGRPSYYCSRACKQRAYRAKIARRRPNPLMLLRQDIRQILETDRLKHVVREVFKEMGVLDFLGKLGFEPAELQPRQLRIVKSLPNDKSGMRPP